MKAVFPRFFSIEMVAILGFMALAKVHVTLKNRLIKCSEYIICICSFAASTDADNASIAQKTLLMYTVALESFWKHVIILHSKLDNFSRKC